MGCSQTLSRSLYLFFADRFLNCVCSASHSQSMPSSVPVLAVATECVMCHGRDLIDAKSSLFSSSLLLSAPFLSFLLAYIKSGYVNGSSSFFSTRCNSFF